MRIYEVGVFREL